jgi:hypothetical protein
VDGSEHFNTVLWTGDGTTDKSKIITVGFQSDFIWQKPRTTADSHSLVDSVRGFNLVMNSNGTSAEVDRPLRIADVDATSFAVADAASNANGVSNVGWNLESWRHCGQQYRMEALRHRCLRMLTQGLVLSAILAHRC